MLKNKYWILTGPLGIMAILFGLVAIVFPTLTITALAVYFAIAIMVGGIVMSFSALRFRKALKNAGLLLFEGLTGLLLGLLMIWQPEYAAASFVVIIGAWALFQGIMLIMKYSRHKRLRKHPGYLLFTGIVSVLLGTLLVLNPFDSTRIIIIIIGVYALVFGIYSVTNPHKIYY